MAITEYSTGTYNPGSTTTTWATQDGPETADGAIQIFIDLNELTAGDTVEMRLLEKTLSTSTARAVWSMSATHAQAEPVFASPVLLLMHGWSFEMRQTAGTVRDFDWSIRSVA
jgi:hypothetical protein